MLKPGTNLGELNHLPKKVCSLGIAKLWAGRFRGWSGFSCPPQVSSSSSPEDQGDGALSRNKENSYWFLSKGFTEQVMQMHTTEER